MYRRLIVLVFLSLFLFWQSFSVESIPAEENRRISVEIRGEIKNPGVYELQLGTTYEDLFAQAVLTDQADISSFSLNTLLYNSQLINVPEKNSRRLISINSASAEELILLPGIGETIAERIIQYRREKGSFLALEDIMNVKGIGYAKFVQIREYITL
jgi:competence protein ComEA